MNRKVWIAITVIVLIISGIFSFIQANPVIALFISDGRIAEVLFRVWNEVMPNSAAGRYYQALTIKHISEFNQILDDHPEHINETSSVIVMFFPVMEALPGDKGDTARITEEQIRSLNLELAWFSSLASPSFRADIEKEQQRFPLEKFIGMTMYEALDFLNSNWPADLTAESILPPTATPLPSPTAYSTITPHPEPTCRIGSAPDCLKRPSLVSNSDRLWAFDIVEGVYFEYPSDWDVKEVHNPEMTVLAFFPPLDSFEDLSTERIFFAVWNFVFPNEINYDEIGCSEDGVFSEPDILLHEQINLSDFNGNKIIWEDGASPPRIFIFSSVYNEDHQLMVCLITVVDNDLTGELLTNPELAEEKYSSIQHILESIRIWDK